MYFINKIVGWVASPLGGLFLGLILGGVLRRLGARRSGSVLQIMTLVSLWILGCGITTRFVGVPLEGEEPALIETLEIGGVDAVVLLGGGMGAHRVCGRAEMFAGADRVWEAARYWKMKGQGTPMRLLCSGGDVEASTVPLLIDLGVSRDAIDCFPAPRNTEEEARTYLELFKGKNEHPRVALVTSAWHMPRAKMLFERVGFEVVPRPTDFEMNYAVERELTVGDFFPSAEALARNSYAIKEWVGRLGYAILKR